MKVAVTFVLADLESPTQCQDFDHFCGLLLRHSYFSEFDYLARALEDSASWNLGEPTINRLPIEVIRWLP
mgnify:CR=1 FL=1